MVDLLNKQIEDLISEYRERAEVGNEHHDRLFEVVRRPRAAGHSADLALLTPLEDEAVVLSEWDNGRRPGND
jgi:hypothetical protein